MYGDNLLTSTGHRDLSRDVFVHENGMDGMDE
jgi:hypothetical protein